MNKVLGIDNTHLKHNPIDDFRQTQRNYSRWSGLVTPDKTLLISIALLMLVGLVMVTTASIPKAGSNGWIFSYAARQLVYMILGCGLGYVVYQIPTQWWYRHDKLILLTGLLLQVSEFVRICVMIYAAAFLQRHQNQLHKSLLPMIKLLGVLGAVAVLLLLEPDFGSTAVICATVLGMMFLAGVCLLRFVVIASLVTVLGGLVMLAAPYRVKRLASFINPWDDVWGSDYQLVNSLIAIGRGKTTGVGIGESLEKHHYLPEAHTDFIFSILAEETGLIGVIVLMLLFAVIVWRVFVIASNADKVRMRFASCLAYGIGLWLGMQALINMSVASGLLPTKGLTLPMISYGGSSVLASMILLAILLRIDSESRYTLLNEQSGRRQAGRQQVLHDDTAELCRKKHLD